MDVSVIIVNYNTLALTSAAIDSVFEHTQGINFEVILVDNGSLDGSRDHFSNDSRIKYIYSPNNNGFGVGNNIGAELATGKYLFFLNSDTLLKNNAIPVLMQFLEENDNVGIVGGQLYDSELMPIHSYNVFRNGLAFELSSLFYHIPERLIDYIKKRTSKNYKVGYITGADMMLRRMDADKYGLFSPDFFMYYEETDVAARYYENGLKSYFVSGSEIVHLVGKSCSYSERKIKMIYQSRHTYYIKHYSYAYIKLCDFIFLLTHYIRIVSYAFFKDKRRNWILRLSCFREIMRQSRVSN